MNFELISPVGADVDPMPMTRPDQTTGTSVSTPTPRRHVHRLLLPHCIIHLGADVRDVHSISRSVEDPRRKGNARTVFLLPACSRGSFSCYLSLSPSFQLLDRCSHYLLSYQRSTFTATYATQHIITITIPNAAGCGRQGRLTTNHRLSAMANDISLLLSVSRLRSTDLHLEDST